MSWLQGLYSFSGNCKLKFLGSFKMQSSTAMKMHIYYSLPEKGTFLSQKKHRELNPENFYNFSYIYINIYTYTYIYIFIYFFYSRQSAKALDPGAYQYWQVWMNFFSTGSLNPICLSTESSWAVQLCLACLC